MVWLRRSAFFGALAFLVLTFVNASWMDNPPGGHLLLIANGGISQQYAPGARRTACPASAILPPIHAIFEDTLRGVSTAERMGADLVAIDVQRTADDALVLFPDTDLACRTQGKGAVAALKQADLAALDVGFGYTADGGKTFPLRGKGLGLIPPLDDVIAAAPKSKLLFRFPADDARTVDLLAADLKRLGRDPVAMGDAFTGAPAAVAAARKAFPAAWSFTLADAQACTSAYRLSGWTGMLPGACAGGTMLAPVNAAFTLWGWPNRLQARMATAKGKVLATLDADGGGLRHSRDLPLIPTTYYGAVMVDDFWTVGPALRPSLDARTNEEALAAQDRDEKAE